MILLYLNLFRSIPALLIYWKITDKTKVNKDIVKSGQSPTAMGLHLALYNDNTCFRNIFYSRVVNQFPLLTKISKFFWRPLSDLGIEVIDGFDGGMQIFHGHSTIVYAKSIGSNFTTYQNVTIGRGKKINGTDIPIIGDDVTVYTGAIIVGGVHIGDRVQVGAGAVVVKDVPADSTVVGGAMRILKR